MNSNHCEIIVFYALRQGSPEFDEGLRRETISEGPLSFPYESHILYYMKQPHGITVVRVLHQSVDPMKHS